MTVSKDSPQAANQLGAQSNDNNLRRKGKNTPNAGDRAATAVSVDNFVSTANYLDPVLPNEFVSMKVLLHWRFNSSLFLS